MLLARLWELAVLSPPHCSTEGECNLSCCTPSPKTASEGAAPGPSGPHSPSHHNSWSLLGVTLITSDYMPAWVCAQTSLRCFSFANSLKGLRTLLLYNVRFAPWVNLIIWRANRVDIRKIISANVKFAGFARLKRLKHFSALTPLGPSQNNGHPRWRMEGKEGR